MGQEVRFASNFIVRDAQVVGQHEDLAGVVELPADAYVPASRRRTAGLAASVGRQAGHKFMK